MLGSTLSQRPWNHGVCNSRGNGNHFLSSIKVGDVRRCCSESGQQNGRDDLTAWRRFGNLMQWILSFSKRPQLPRAELYCSQNVTSTATVWLADCKEKDKMTSTSHMKVETKSFQTLAHSTKLLHQLQGLNHYATQLSLRYLPLNYETMCTVYGTLAWKLLTDISWFSAKHRVAVIN